jgi:hypothetical protein
MALYQILLFIYKMTLEDPIETDDDDTYELPEAINITDKIIDTSFIETNTFSDKCITIKINSIPHIYVYDSHNFLIYKRPLYLSANLSDSIKNNVHHCKLLFRNNDTDFMYDTVYYDINSTQLHSVSRLVDYYKFPPPEYGYTYYVK